MRLSVVIPNYNYERFVAEAIESALAIDWPDTEVVVVDDGSTDGSREIINGYVPRITAVFQENAGPRVACNRGFAETSGDVVIFLDSDDVLAPGIARSIAGVWREGISKVQFQMRRIDAESRELDSVFPDFPADISAATIRSWMLATSAYPTPPGSGNAYARRFLERLFPLDGSCGDATDSATLAAAPLLGDVVTVREPLVKYRVHGNTRSYLLADPGRFGSQIDRAVRRHRFALEVAGRTPDLRPLRRSRHLLQMRIAGRRVAPTGATMPGDSSWAMFVDTVRSPFAPGPEGASTRAKVAAWCLVTLVAPAAQARSLVERRFRQPQYRRN